MEIDSDSAPVTPSIPVPVGEIALPPSTDSNSGSVLSTMSDAKTNLTCEVILSLSSRTVFILQMSSNRGI